MQVNVEEISSVQKKITIEIPAERINDEIERSFSAIQKKAKIQGFRPGKAPMNLIKRTYSDAMRDDVTRRLYEQTLFKALGDHKIEPVDSPTIESDLLVQGSPFKYSAVVEVMPQITLNEYAGLDVKKEIYSPSQESINGELARMQDNMAQLVPVDENCEIENGFTVSVDYSFSVDGLPEETSVAEDAVIEVGSNRLIPGFEDQLIGMKTGETKEFSIVLPDGYRNTEAAGKQGLFKVTINSVKKKELPELDDDFAQQFGEFETISDLRAKMAEYHENHELERIENELKDRVIKALIEKNPIDVPESMVKRQLDYMLENLKGRLKSQQMSLDMMGLDESGFRIRFRNDAIDKVKGGLLLMALVDKEQIAVSEEDLNNRFVKIAAENPDMLNRIKEYYSANQSAKNSLITEIKEDKAISLLIDKAVITEVSSAELKAA